MEDDFDNFEDISKIETYAQFLDRFVTDEDRMYLEDEELARDVKELYAVIKGEIRSKADFERKKKEIEAMNQEEDNKERPLFSLNMEYRKGSFLDQLAERESEVRNGRKSTIIFIRYKDKKGKETSAYIDFRERLKSDEMEGVFKEGKPLLPKPTDLSYYNWTLQKVNSTDSTFFRVDAGPKERLSFKNNTDRKIINVDLEYIEKHPGLDVKRIPINIKNKDGSRDFKKEGQSNKAKFVVTPVDVKKENSRMKKANKKKGEEEENIELKYFSEDMKYKNGTFLAQLKQREKDIQSGQKSTIIFVRYKDKKGVETSAYIDFRERLKDEEEMNGIFKEGRPLLPKPTDLSYYNWTLQKVNSTDSNFFRVDAGPKERLSFKNNTNRKIINVDLEYLEAHPGLDIKRIPIMNNNRDGTKDFIQDSKNSKVQVTHVDVMKENSRLKKVNKKKMEKDNDNNNWGYQQIVIFDYEQKKYN